MWLMKIGIGDASKTFPPSIGDKLAIITKPPWNDLDDFPTWTLSYEYFYLK